VVLHDDASTDSSVSIAREIASRFPSLVRITQNPVRLGVVENFEKAIEATRGDVVFLSDQDDFWLPNRLESMMRPFHENDQVGLVYCNAQIADASLRPIGGTVFASRQNIGVQNNRPARELVRGVDIGIGGCTMAFRARLKPFVLPIARSWAHDHWIAFIAHALMDVSPVPEPLMYYRRHERNSGFDFDLDGAWWKSWLKGARTTGLGTYSSETERWQDMVERLNLIAGGDLPPTSREKIRPFVTESQRRLEFARTRESLKRKARRERISTGLRLLFRGDYHFYVHGLRSFGKDLVVR
jgi:glycosyltransferase involved in cell wall biosynthesis